MKHIYFELFHVSKHEKVSEKVMLTRIAISIAIIIACMVAMSFAAYAYFSYGLYSSQSTIAAANYELLVKSGEEEISGVKNITETAEFTISPTIDTRASVGYCKIDIVTSDSENNMKTYTFYTEPIWREADEQNNKLSSRTVKIEIPQGNMVTVGVSFTAEWGTYSGEAIANDTITANDIGLGSVQKSTNNNDNPQSNDVQETDNSAQQPSDSTPIASPNSSENKTDNKTDTATDTVTDTVTDNTTDNSESTHKETNE